MAAAKATRAATTTGAAPQPETPPVDAPATILSAADIKRYDLPGWYVERVEAGLEPDPTKRMQYGDQTDHELIFAGGAWQVIHTGTKPGAGR